MGYFRRIIVPTRDWLLPGCSVILAYQTYIARMQYEDTEKTLSSLKELQDAWEKERASQVASSPEGISPSMNSTGCYEQEDRSSSKLGKMLMAKCRTLQAENEEIGEMASEGKIHELAMKIAMLKSQNTELRNQFDSLYKHMDVLSKDVERSNEMVYMMQEKLAAKDYEINRLKQLLEERDELAVDKRGDDIVAADLVEAED